MLDLLVARGYDLSRADKGSVAQAVETFRSESSRPSMRLDLLLPAAEKMTLVLEAWVTTRSG
jgi:hypothetical protein